MCEICGRYICPPGCPNAELPDTACRCDECGKKLLYGDNVTKIKGFSFCEDCVIENTRELEE